MVSVVVQIMFGFFVAYLELNCLKFERIWVECQNSITLFQLLKQDHGENMNLNSLCQIIHYERKHEVKGSKPSKGFKSINVCKLIKLKKPLSYIGESTHNFLLNKVKRECREKPTSA